MVSSNKSNCEGKRVNINYSRRVFLKNSINIAIATGVLSVVHPSISYAMSKSGYKPLFTFNNPGYCGYMYFEGLNKYLVGPGRVYSSKIAQFISTDRLAPFGEAGVNRYAYSDPINSLDATGYLSWQAWLGIALGIATIISGGIGLAAVAGTIYSGGITGALLIAKVSLATVSGITGITSGTLAIASGIISETHPTLSGDLGLAATVFGVTATATGLAAWGVGERMLAKGLTSPPVSSNLVRPVKAAMAMTKHDAWWATRYLGSGRSAFSTAAQVKRLSRELF
ncbi:hypothetical protein L1D31_22245 [Vibrio sp. Isolate23]|uniref:hypothetical protein n=1 Tax=Vibrio sp. Isolate23 TaxID=2908533 RepID=UPI001EFD4A29|nr:hypothetical protein [Vibrio sp. Isolate23]MCG9685240.1 hypothetical protein [Vibrio sp. Isolate23]